MVDVFSLRFLLAALIGWLDRQQQEALAYLIEELTDGTSRGHGELLILYMAERVGFGTSWRSPQPVQTIRLERFGSVPALPRNRLDPIKCLGRDTY